MKNLVKGTPYALCGLVLGMMSLGTLMKGLSYVGIGYAIAVVATLLLLLVIAKIFIAFPLVKEEFKNIGVASTAPTLPMSLELLTTFLLPFPKLRPLAVGIWWVAVGIHFCLMLFYVYNFFIRPKKTWEIVYPSWFVTLVGIGVITVTAKNYYPPLGIWMFYLGLVLYLAALPFVLYRVFIYKKLPEAALPLTTIIAAPGSLLLAGYMEAFTPQKGFTIFLFVLSQILYIVALLLVRKNLRLPFYPTYGGFTFPLVISAKACVSAVPYLITIGLLPGFFQNIAFIETGIALGIVAYVLICYLRFLKAKVKA